MKIAKVLTMIFLVVCFFLPSCGGKEANKNSGPSIYEEVDEALAHEDFPKAYSVVDGLLGYLNSNDFVPTLNKKVMMAEIGYVFESDMESKNKAARLILIIEERSKYNDEGAYNYNSSEKEKAAKQEMFDMVINIADAQGDNELKYLLEKAKNKIVTPSK